MRVRGRRRKSVAFFITLSACLVALAIALNVGWVILNWREVALLVFGIIFFLVLIFGLVLNTTFLIREIRRNEQHDAFINAVTHELKTPIASIRLYLETLKAREVDEEQRQEFYNIMLADSDRPAAAACPQIDHEQSAPLPGRGLPRGAALAWRLLYHLPPHHEVSALDRCGHRWEKPLGPIFRCPVTPPVLRR